MFFGSIKRQLSAAEEVKAFPVIELQRGKKQQKEMTLNS